MKRILCIVGGMNTGGAETFLMKIYRQLDKEKYQMDFCVGESKKCFYDDEIEIMGGKIIHITKKTKNPLKSFIDIKNVVKNGRYNNVIRISQHSMSSIDLLAAKFGGAKNLIFRSSNSNSCGSLLNRIVHVIFKPFAILIPNVKIAPSDVSAIHMFGKKMYKKNKVVILKNGLSINNFKFNEKIREAKRNELGLNDNDFVIGHVGRMTEQKNHAFLLDIFEQYLKINKNAKLILIGDGELRKQIEKRIYEKGLVNNVLILGVRLDTNELYQAMDCFVFPSFYEGMPNTVIEAQTSGLVCVISSSITKEVALTNNVTFCNLNEKKSWIDNIKLSTDRENTYKSIQRKGYDIAAVVETFLNYII